MAFPMTRVAPTEDASLPSSPKSTGVASSDGELAATVRAGSRGCGDYTTLERDRLFPERSHSVAEALFASSPLIYLERALSDTCTYPIAQSNSQFFRGLPDDMRILASIEVQVIGVDNIFPTRENHRDPKPHGESRFEIDSASRLTFVLSEICHQKS